MRKLQARARAAELRIRLRDVVSRSALLLPVPLIYALGALTAIKVLRPAAEVERWLLLGGLVPVLVFAVGALWPLFARAERWRGALALDRHHGLHDRVTNALAFASEKEKSPLMEAAILDALPHADGLSPRRAVPLRLPRELLISVGLAALVHGVSLLEVRTTRVVTTQVNEQKALVLNGDDVELLREWSRELAENTKDPRVAEAVRKFNQLVEDIAERRLDRREIFERLEQLEQALALGNEGLDAALDEGLSGIARELEKSGSTKPIAQALEDKNLADAERAVRELAERLRQKPAKVNKAELERIRKALEAASKQSSERLAGIDERRREVEQAKKRLLEKKNKGEALSKAEQKKLEDHERQLKRLDRQKQNAKQAADELSQLDRDLAEAARKLMEEMGKDPASSQQALEDVAQDINRVAQKKLSTEEKEALKKQLEELRQLLRQQKQGGKKRDEALERFRQMARGGGQQPGGPGGQGQGQQGQGRGKSQLRLGPGQGAGVELPMPGAGSGASPSGGEGQGEQAGQAPGSKQWGSSTTDDIQGDATTLQGETQDVSAAGIDSGQGEASVEVVFGAAERGFTGRGYRKVYTDYKTVAEEVLEKDEIPPGYEFYVRRYFQLIRPRD